ncbi:hypothetical protein NA78x_003024 [Anatilimnocola sp. NA78]|uniref:hypothetical protein n=1 Tax=Anatilimnocola sp. NA78 TaxID=3415683 RepID=UPI003CE4E178
MSEIAKQILVALILGGIMTTSAFTQERRRPFPPLITAEAARLKHDSVLSGIPSLEDIASITAEKTIGAPYGSEIAALTVPPESYQEIMAFFQGSEIDVDPMP